MKFEEYYRSLKGTQRDDYAEKAGTTRAYIEAHLLAPIERRKTPRQPLMKSLAEASDGACSMEDVIGHFFQIAA